MGLIGTLIQVHGLRGRLGDVAVVEGWHRLGRQVSHGHAELRDDLLVRQAADDGDQHVRADQPLVPVAVQGVDR